MAITDDIMLDALKKRVLREIERSNAGLSGPVFNNYAGASPAGGPLHGISELGSQSHNEQIDPDLYDYMVDITREDLPDINPATGKPVGWKKSVKSYRAAKQEPPTHKKKRKT